MRHACPGLKHCTDHPKWSVTKERSIWVVNVPRTDWCLGVTYFDHADAVRAARKAMKETK